MNKNKGDDGASFDKRLNAARARQGLDTPPPPESPGGGIPPNMMGVGLRVGVELVSALVVAVAIGYGLDRWLHTLPLFLILFVLMGGAAGLLNVWRLVQRRPGPTGPGKQ
jgi:ATP synthase protein I